MSVRGSEFVLDSGSTATSFSVLGSKPIIYVAPGARPGAIDWRPASAFATSLGLPVHHELASFADSLAGTLRVDHDQYERYRRLYLFSDGSTRRTFAEEMMMIIDQHGLS